ncbi:MAG: 2-oxo acid dehydrogenase subunit E2 [Clostridiales bacterium]
MAKEFTLPELGENITSADVLQVLIKPGDMVSIDQVVMEIETDKATIEVPSQISGIVKEVNIKAGDKAKIGQVIFTVEDSSANKEEVPSDGASSKQKASNQSKSLSEEAKETISSREEAKKEAKIEEKPKAEAEILPKTETKQGGIIEVKLPELGENILKADVLQVKVSPGDVVKKDQIILEIETDKATIEVPSEVSGTVKEVFVKAGQKASVGQVIFTVAQEEEEEGDAAAQPKGKTDASTLETIDKSIIEKMTSAELEEKVVKPEEVSEQKQAETAEKGKETSKEKLATPEKTKLYREERTQTDPSKIAPAAPTVRRFAREIGIDINEVPGSGPGGRISISDVKAYSREVSKKQKQALEAPRVGAGVPAEQLPDFSKWGEVEKRDMSNVRRKTAEHLSYAWATVPHVTQFGKADITELENLRKNYGKRAEAEGGKLTVTAILLKVVASALKTFPQFNSSVDMQNNAVLYKKFYNVGVAVDTDRGLLVPVIKNVDKKNIIELSIELNKMAEKARNKKLSLEEMQGGTFTITNLGGIGGTYFSPIVNSPEVAILGVSRSQFEPVYIDGEFKPRLMLPLSLSYDHRIIDGADGARFLKWIIDAIEQPFLMALEG